MAIWRPVVAQEHAAVTLAVSPFTKVRSTGTVSFQESFYKSSLRIHIFYATATICLSTMIKITTCFSTYYPKMCVTNNILPLDFKCAKVPHRANLLHLGDHVFVDDVHVGLRDLDQCRHNDFCLLSSKP